MNYDRLGLRGGDLLLDLGCGFGRHAFEGFRRGARVVACDLSAAELKDVRATFQAMKDAGEGPPEGFTATVNGNALSLPFADGTFDQVIASEVLEHIPDDGQALSELTRVLRSGGTMAVTVPTWFPEQICWRLSDEYYAPKAEGGHVRIYRERDVRERMAGAGLEVAGSHHAHALHSPYWWLKCAVGPTNNEHPAVKAYHRLLVWDIERHPAVMRLADTALNPLIGKSLVVYAHKRAGVSHAAA